VTLKPWVVIGVDTPVRGVLVRVLASNPVDREFEPRLSQTKDIGIWCFAFNHVKEKEENYIDPKSE